MKLSRRYGRRAFLGGATALIGLPFLESLAPREALGQAASAPKRFLGYVFPNGVMMDDWRPIGTGKDFTLGKMLGASGRVFDDGLAPFPASEDGPSLEQVRAQLLIVSGMQSNRQLPGPGDHSGGMAAFLTDRSAPKDTEAALDGPSIDFLLSQAIGKDTRRPYFAMSAEATRPAGTICDSGFSCAVADHISFDEQGHNLPRIETPGEMFDQLFQGFDPAASAQAALERKARAQSVLDLVLGEASSLQNRISRQDRPRLQEYLQSVREVERRIASQASQNIACAPPARTGAFEFEDGRATIDVCHELIALAFQCDATRVVSFMWGNSTSLRPYAFIGAPGGHHDLSHYGDSAESIAQLRRIDYWWARRFAELLIRLQGMPDSDGRSVLDNTLVFQSSDVSDGDQHNHDDMPVIIAGGAAGFSLGRHLELKDRWFGELFLSIGQAFGLPLKTFGENGTQIISELTI